MNLLPTPGKRELARKAGRDGSRVGLRLEQSKPGPWRWKSRPAGEYGESGGRPGEGLGVGLLGRGSHYF